MNVRALLAAAGIALGVACTASAGPEAYLGEVMLTGSSWCPENTLPANGKLLSIMDNQALFSLLGTMYGGNGQTTFALPNLQGRAAINSGRGPGLSAYEQGVPVGTETVQLTTEQLPAHRHTVGPHTHEVGVTSSPPNTNDGAGALLSEYPETANAYTTGATADGTMAVGSVTPGQVFVGDAGGTDALNIVQPVLPMTYCIVVKGNYPPRP